MITKTNYDSTFSHRHIDDVKRIQNVCLNNGYKADLQDCANIWDKHSDSYAAGWLGLPDEDDELWNIIEEEVKYK